MNVQQVAKMTGLPEKVLIKMRSRETVSFKSGPPFHKTMGKGGETIYEYKLKEVREWMRLKNCDITAGDAASIMGISRDEIKALHGVQALDVNDEEGYKGKIVINNPRNIFLWVPEVKSRKKKAKKKK